MLDVSSLILRYRTLSITKDMSQIKPYTRQFKGMSTFGLSRMALSTSIYNASRLMVLRTTFVLLKKIPNLMVAKRSLQNA